MSRMFSKCTSSSYMNALREMVQPRSHGADPHKPPCGTPLTHHGRLRKKKRSKQQLEDQASMVEVHRCFVVEIPEFSHVGSLVAVLFQ